MTGELVAVRARSKEDFVVKQVRLRESRPMWPPDCADDHLVRLADRYFELAIEAERDGDVDWAERYLNKAIYLLN